MTTDELNVSLEADLGAEVRRSAREAGVEVSAWLAEAAATKLRGEAFAEFVREWEQEHGPLKVSDLARADEALSAAERAPSS